MSKTNVYKMGILPEVTNVDTIRRHPKYGFGFLSVSDFDDYLEDHKDTVVSGYTTLKKIKETADVDRVYIIDQNDDQIFFKFNKLAPRETLKPWYKVTGYAMLNDGTFVMLVQPLYILLLFFLLLLCVIFAVIPKGEPEDTGLTFEPEHKIEEPAPGEAYTETIDIPGYGSVTLSEKKKEIQLINPEGNSVYFVYTLSEDDTEVYKTDAILPGNSVMADLWSILDAGDHNITIAVATYDVETEETCNGTAQTINVMIEK